ncbi:hypothetical protein JW905_03390 [bacterium]|nr:hypothetical protein [candidate division CSSED10-310 bacterium]
MKKLMIKTALTLMAMQLIQIRNYCFSSEDIFNINNYNCSPLDIILCLDCSGSKDYRIQCDAIALLDAIINNMKEETDRLTLILFASEAVAVCEQATSDELGRPLLELNISYKDYFRKYLENIASKNEQLKIFDTRIPKKLNTFSTGFSDFNSLFLVLDEQMDKCLEFPSDFQKIKGRDLNSKQVVIILSDGWHERHETFCNETFTLSKDMNYYENQLLKRGVYKVVQKNKFVNNKMIINKPFIKFYLHQYRSINKSTSASVDTNREIAYAYWDNIFNDLKKINFYVDKEDIGVKWDAEDVANLLEEHRRPKKIKLNMWETIDYLQYYPYQDFEVIFSVDSELASPRSLVQFL